MTRPLGSIPIGCGVCRLLDHIGVPVFLIELDEDQRPVYSAFNRAGCDLWGLVAADVIGKSADQVFPGRLGRTVYAHHVETVQSKTSGIYDLSLSADGAERRFRTTLEPVLADNGEVRHLVGMSIDVTAERSIQEARADARTLAMEMEQYVNMAAHDLRGPMRTIGFIADSLRDGFQDLGDGKIELIGRLEGVATKTMSLISDVLSQAQSTGAEESRVAFDFGELCADILLTLDPLEKHRVTCSSTWISGDRTATQIVVRNLVDNAIKHGGRDSMALSIAVTEGRKGMFDVIVRDDGIGFRAPESVFADDMAPGIDSGLGLIGIRRLVEARGGDIQAIVPEDGKGAAVRFALPGRVLEQEDIEHVKRGRSSMTPVSLERGAA